MSRTIRRITAAVLTVVLLTFSSFSAAAADISADDPVSAAQLVTQANPAQNELYVAGIRRLTDDEIEAISDRISSQSKVYLVELRDGRYTYYMTVDFRTDDAVYLSKLPVLRKTSHKLFDRSEQMAKDDADKAPDLMDYTHIVGEIGVHHVIYRLTDALGGASLKGILGKIYGKSTVADLNIDESRFPVIIRIVGLLIGE